MSCCPPAPEINIGGSGDEDYAAQDTELRRGESVDCYMLRAGNTTGRMDDKTDNVPNTIANTDIPLKNGVTVDVIFKMVITNPTQSTTTRTPNQWRLYNEAGVPVTSLGTASFSSQGTVARLQGTFSGADLGKSFKIKVSAIDGDGEIDQRGFTFAPATATGSNDIQLLHPLPGARVTSKFGPRRPPTSGASSIHGGADFAHEGGKITDVLCAADGEVVFTGFQSGGAGNYIKVKHLNGSGSPMCTTVYMHLAKIYVSVGQKMTAGQKLGLEGNTGVGTGAHLHFECRLPNETKIDPVPLIRGELQVAQATDASNQGTAYESTGNQENKLTRENVEARENGCAPFGTDYPKQKPEIGDTSVPPAETTPPPAPITDPFERAWFFTMQHEVGPQWTAASPGDSDVAQGLIDTTARQKKVGYVNTPSYPGGETKFGIAQGPNPQLDVTALQYDPAKTAGYNNYWKKGSSILVDLKPKSAIMLFDMAYLHGPGNAKTIRSAALISNKTDDESVVALAESQQEFMRQIVIANPDRQKYINGWLKRSRDLLTYVQSL